MTCVAINGNLFPCSNKRKKEGTENVQKKFINGNETAERLCRNAIAFSAD